MHIWCCPKFPRVLLTSLYFFFLFLLTLGNFNWSNFKFTIFFFDSLYILLSPSNNFFYFLYWIFQPYIFIWFFLWLLSFCWHSLFGEALSSFFLLILHFFLVLKTYKIDDLKYSSTKFNIWLPQDSFHWLSFFSPEYGPHFVAYISFNCFVGNRTFKVIWYNNFANQILSPTQSLLLLLLYIVIVFATPMCLHGEFSGLIL